MLWTLMGNFRSMGFLELLIIVISYAALIFVMLPLHEWAHAFVATRLGDYTARWNGRLTLNPFAHLDPVGAVMLVLFGLGYARPVPVNPRNFRNPKRDMMLTALAGPVSNLLMALISLIAYRVILLLPFGNLLKEAAFIVFVVVFASVNLGLAVFNLLPVPPLDGSRIFAFVLPARWVNTMEYYSRYLTLGILLLLFTGVLDVPLDFLRHILGGVLCAICGLPNYF